MTIRVNKFTPEVLLSAPRRSAAVPSADGKYALYSQSSYSFESHSRKSEIFTLDIASGQTRLLSDDSAASEPKWLGDGHEVVWLKEGENGNTSFVVSDALENGWTYTAGTVAGPISNLKLYAVERGRIAIAVAGQANPDGSLYNSKDVTKSYSSARLYNSLFVRHWDTYVGKQRNTIWTAILQKAAPHVTDRTGRYNLVGLNNALKGTNLESPIPPWGGTDHFDIGREGIIFVAKDPCLNPATHTKCSCYLTWRNWKDDLTGVDVSEPIKIEPAGLEGAATSPAFSPDGNSFVYLQMQEDGYEADRNRIVLYLNINANAKEKQNPCVQGIELLRSDDGKAQWERSPSSITFSADAKSFLIQAEDIGCGCLFELPVPPNPTNIPRDLPRKLTSSGYISSVVPAAANSDKLFISSTSFVDNSAFYILDPSAPSSSNTTLVSSLTHSGNLFGLSPSQVSSIWWKGANDHPVHAWMMKPSFFKSGHKYALAYLIHGGPQGAWGDQWSTRWNPAVFAEQGYVVVLPNPTGSTGYGQDFTDAIRLEWGGLPYEDLVRGFTHLETDPTLSSIIDTSRAVALGASYGGYMMNWMQGHPLSRKFKALVCHDGVFSMTAQTASDEQYFPMHDLGGPIWDAQKKYDKWDPARFTANWATPQLTIHNELDYRLTIAEGLAAFNVLQMRGVESLFLTFPDENHWVLKHENSLVWHRVVINWCNKFVGLPPLLDKEGKTGLEDAMGSKSMKQ